MSRLIQTIYDSRTRSLAIAQDLIALVTRRVSPKQITTASTVRHLTGSKLVVNLLSCLGHSASYTELQRFETAAALTKLQIAAENGVIIDSNIEGDWGFLQAAADNDDFCEDSKDGKKTTHATTMVLYQSKLIGMFSDVNYS